jgi:hypothetical protein
MPNFFITAAIAILQPRENIVPLQKLFLRRAYGIP